MAELVAYTAISSPIGKLHVVATPRGLCKIAFGDESKASWLAWLRRAVCPAALVEQETDLLRLVDCQLVEYFEKRRRIFDLPLDLRGTDFQRAVWAAVTAIPYGQTRSYANIASAVGRPSAARAVGAANGANPLPLVIPCHRVLGANGALTGYGGGLELKRFLLELESNCRNSPFGN